MSHPAPPPAQPLGPRQQSKPIGLLAGAEDVKYQAKYKDLKRKVKEIEADNDKLHYKVLTAKRNVQRMKLERAILYERLSTVPPSPEPQDRLPLPLLAGPPSLPSGSSHQNRRDSMPNVNLRADPRDVRILRDDRDREPRDMRDFRDTRQGRDNQPEVRDLRAVRDGRESWDARDYDHHNGPSHIQAPDRHVVEHSRMPPAGFPPMNTLPPVRSTRRSSVSSNSHDRPHMTLPPLHHLDAPPLMHRNTHAQHQSPLIHHSRSNPIHERSHDRQHEHPRVQTTAFNRPNHPPNHSLYPPPLDSQPQHPMTSPLLSDRDRSDRPVRRHDIHELTSSSRESHSRPRQHSPLPPLSPRRVHDHQRLGPGTYLNGTADDHERELERERDRQREREWERDRNAREHDQRDRARDRERFEEQEREREREREPEARPRDRAIPSRSSMEAHHRSRAHPETYSPRHQSSSRPVHSREEHQPPPQSNYYADGPSYPARAGSESPRSTSGSGPTPDEPSSVHYEHYFDSLGPPTTRSYRLRPVAPQPEMDFVHEDGRSYLGREGRPLPPGQVASSDIQSTGIRTGGGGTGASESSRKRSRNDMVDEDVDMDRDRDHGEGAGTSASYADGRAPKRSHHDRDRDDSMNGNDRRESR